MSLRTSIPATVAVLGTALVLGSLWPTATTSRSVESHAPLRVFDYNTGSDPGPELGVSQEAAAPRSPNRMEAPSRGAGTVFVPSPPAQHRGPLPQADVDKRIKSLARAVDMAKKTWLPTIEKQQEDPRLLPTRDLFQMCNESWALPLREDIWGCAVAEAKARIAQLEASREILVQGLYWTCTDQAFREEVWPTYNKIGSLLMEGRHRNAAGETVLLVCFVSPTATPALTSANANAKQTRRVVWAKLCTLFNARPEGARESVLKEFHRIARIGPKRPLTSEEAAFSERNRAIFHRPRYVRIDDDESRLVLIGP